MKKKAYISPEAIVIQVAPMSLLAGSDLEINNITDRDNYGEDDEVD